ncbi:hypothetical protein [Chlamydia sp.]|uniref:hypothetical protein n=1 Tax=Chlamydia sp. TaxID=35827 RepID=UPI0025BC4DA9|nr:hypothetical protein [Chlamydia sp.]MBQ8498390.1 hypothetical protein [Chlamydia sp.]
MLPRNDDTPDYGSFSHDVSDTPPPSYDEVCVNNANPPSYDEACSHHSDSSNRSNCPTRYRPVLPPIQEEEEGREDPLFDPRNTLSKIQTVTQKTIFPKQ